MSTNINTNDKKEAYYAEMNGKMAALNIIRLAKGEPLLKYPEACIIYIYIYIYTHTHIYIC